MRTHSKHSETHGAVRVARVAAVFGIVAATVTSGAAVAHQRSGEVERGQRDQLVVGTGPHAVYIGQAPNVGGDAARGETEESYYARTGRHLPGRSAAQVDGPWWYGHAPLYGGDPASGETDASYYARTGRHLG